MQNEILSYLKAHQTELMSHYLLYLKTVLQDFYKNELIADYQPEQKTMLVQVLRLLASQCQNSNKQFQDFLKVQQNMEKK